MCIQLLDKVINPKYSQYCSYILAYTIDFDFNKMLNHGWCNRLFFFFFKFLWWKYFLDWIDSSEWNLNYYINYKFWFYLIYKLICPKPAHFLFVQMDFLRSFLEMFITLGMYNFVFRAKSSFMCNSLDPRTLPWWKLRKNFWHFTKIHWNMHCNHNVYSSNLKL